MKNFKKIINITTSILFTFILFMVCLHIKNKTGLDILENLFKFTELFILLNKIDLNEIKKRVANMLL